MAQHASFCFTPISDEERGINWSCSESEGRLDIADISFATEVQEAGGDRWVFGRINFFIRKIFFFFQAKDILRIKKGRNYSNCIITWYVKDSYSW